MSPYSPLRVHRQEVARETLTISQAIGFLLLGLAYAFPGEFVRAQTENGMTNQRYSVVRAFETFFGFQMFTLLFGVAGVLMLVAGVWWAITKRRKPPPQVILKHYKLHAWAHLVATSVAMTYSLTLITTGIINPGTYIVTGLFALGVTATNAILMYAYAGK